ncbi:MAG TPA: DUF2231 domain-containing protein [Candidatus Limnocylindria bacterium]|nr:DUF2231 domain-containing protein [Candidatus Limnocylindria bacterium]
MAQTRARISKHPIHPMLVVFPIGLWGAAVVFDIVHAFTGNPLWRSLAFWNILGGIVGALVAAVPGLIDYSEMQGRARRIANWHMALNFGITALFAVNLLLRTEWGTRFISADSWIPLGLSVVGNAVLGVSGWLGGEMVYVERVGVQDKRELRPEDKRRAA